MWEHLGDYTFLYFLSFIKYFVAPIFGWARGLNFFEIAMSCFAGAYTSFNIFFWGSSYFFKRAAKKRETSLKKKRNFTKLNRIIVKMRRLNLGFLLITFLCPMFLSVPIGTLIVVKFYRHDYKTFLVTSLFIGLWSIILTASYMFAR